jgi:hypothetical protein
VIQHDVSSVSLCDKFCVWERLVFSLRCVRDSQLCALTRSHYIAPPPPLCLRALRMCTSTSTSTLGCASTSTPPQMDVQDGETTSVAGYCVRRVPLTEVTCSFACSLQCGVAHWHLVAYCPHGATLVSLNDPLPAFHRLSARTPTVTDCGTHDLLSQLQRQLFAVCLPRARQAALPERLLPDALLRH